EQRQQKVFHFMKNPLQRGFSTARSGASLVPSKPPGSRIPRRPLVFSVRCPGGGTVAAFGAARKGVPIEVPSGHV
ncbi:MAG TPA: hypothetical protein VMT52_06960, partial [Planctomycetota bacterium]|nr:hypothetical protein [Planctomycetota bacterium]